MTTIFHEFTLTSLSKLVLCVGLVFQFSYTYAQDEELWFGTYTSDEGKVLQGRYKVVQNGSALVSLVLEPYGQAAAEFNIIENDTVQNFVKVSWPNNSKRIGTLIRYNDWYYAGNFAEGTKVLPIVIKKFNFQDAQLQGNWFIPSETEVKIIDHTIKLLNATNAWNKSVSRICEANGSYSLFCALYHSSIIVDGEYRHLRPAIKFVREAIQDKYPKKYDHVLVDFNKAKEITLKEVNEILNLAKTNLIESLHKAN